jgi:hypothetical protein
MLGNRPKCTEQCNEEDHASLGRVRHSRGNYLVYRRVYSLEYRQKGKPVKGNLLSSWIFWVLICAGLTDIMYEVVGDQVLAALYAILCVYGSVRPVDGHET